MSPNPKDTSTNNKATSASGNAPAKTTGYQGSNRKSNDHVFEAKRSQYDSKMSSIDSQIKTLKQKMNTIAEDIRNLSAKDANSAAREELRVKINGLKSQRDNIRAQKEPVFQKLQATQQLVRSKIDELQSSKDKSAFKKPEDIDNKIKQMEAEIESGSLKLIDEKKLVAEISKLRKLRKNLDSFSAHEASISDMKKAIEQYRAILSGKDNELKAVDEQLKAHSGEMTKLSSSRNASQGKIKALISDRDALRKEVDALYQAKSAAFEEFQAAQKAHQVWIEAERVKYEEMNVRREIETSVRDLERQLKHLEIPACSDQIEQCSNLQNYLRTNVLKESVSPSHSSASNNAAPNAHALRQVEKVSDDLVLKKEQVEDNYSIASKKSAKGKKPSQSAPVAPGQSMKLPFWVLSSLEELKIKMVTNVDEAKEAIAALEQRREGFEQEQKKKASTVDSERAAIQARLDKQKARFDHVAEEAAVRLKANAQKKAAAQSSGASSSSSASKLPATSSEIPVAN